MADIQRLVKKVKNFRILLHIKNIFFCFEKTPLKEYI